jgi:putative transposase
MWTPEQRERHKDDRRRYRSDLSDQEWAAIAPRLAAYHPLSADLREMVNACRYLHRTGCGWRYLPKEFRPLGDGQKLA